MEARVQKLEQLVERHSGTREARRSADAIPRTVATWLSDGVDEGERGRLVDQLRAQWSRLREQQMGQTDDGWSEFLADFLIACELVASRDDPGEVLAEYGRSAGRSAGPIEPTIAACYRARRLRYARYALRIDNDAVLPVRSPRLLDDRGLELPTDRPIAVIGNIAANPTVTGRDCPREFAPGSSASPTAW